jgi:hypothetical protein
MPKIIAWFVPFVLLDQGLTVSLYHPAGGQLPC